MRIMAIDYGDAHTGVAISDPTGMLAGWTTTIDSRKQDVVVENGRRGKKRKQKVDAVAATLILEGYLGFRRNQKERE